MFFEGSEGVETREGEASSPLGLFGLYVPESKKKKKKKKNHVLKRWLTKWASEQEFLKLQ